MTEKVCEFCGEKFTGEKRRRFCSLACSNRRNARALAGRPRQLCSIDPAHGPILARGWCANCYQRWYWRGGDPAVTLPKRVPTLLDQRLQYEIDANGCWVWTGAFQRRWGYGQVRIGGKTVVAHKAWWDFNNGPVPDGMELDHLCANKRCINLEHLEPVTRSENLRRGGKPHLREPAQVLSSESHR